MTDTRDPAIVNFFIRRSGAHAAPAPVSLSPHVTDLFPFYFFGFIGFFTFLPC